MALTAGSRPLETEMSTALIGHRAVRGSVDYWQFNFLRATAATAVAHLSHRNYVHLSHGWISQKRY